MGTAVLLSWEESSFSMNTEGWATLSKSYKNISYLCELDPKEFIFQRESILMSFIEGVSGRNLKNEGDSATIFYLASLIENIYFLVNFNWILPHSFVSNLIQSFISKSKIVTTINGKIYPAGGYSSYLTWLKDVGSEMLKSPTGDVETYFDNIGKYIVRNHHISKEKYSGADIITSTLHICLQGDLQSNENLKPCYWEKEKSIQEIQTRMGEILQESHIVFRKVRFNYIEQMIQLFKCETSDISKRISDLLTFQKRRCINEVGYFSNTHTFLV